MNPAQPAAAAAAAGAAVPPLPVPVRPRARFANIFSDASRDPTHGRPGVLDAPFVHNINNPATNTTTEAIKNRIAISGAQRLPIAVTIISGGKARAYSFLFWYEDGLTQAHPDLADKYFGVEWELFNKHPHVVEINQSVFHLITNYAVVPTVATIAAEFAADPAVAQLGPYAVQDAGTKSVKTCKIAPIPHSLIETWLSYEDGITTEQFWRVIYPAIVSSGIVDACKSLIQLFQVDVTMPINGNLGDPSTLLTERS